MKVNRSFELAFFDNSVLDPIKAVAASPATPKREKREVVVKRLGGDDMVSFSHSAGSKLKVRKCHDKRSGKYGSRDAGKRRIPNPRSSSQLKILESNSCHPAIATVNVLFNRFLSEHNHSDCQNT